jgi:hypothetical protein
MSEITIHLTCSVHGCSWQKSVLRTSTKAKENIYISSSKHIMSHILLAYYKNKYAIDLTQQ